MNSSLRRKARRIYSGIIQKGGRIALPPDLSTFRLGQRVYFHVCGQDIGFQVKPKRIVRGRLLSSRVRRIVRTLAIYGPRARDASRGSR